MLTRAAALTLAVTVTLSLALTPGFISIFPFMLPVAVLIFGKRYEVNSLPLAFMALATFAAVSAVVTGASLGYAILWAFLAGLYLIARYRLPEVLSPRAVARSFAFVVCAVCLLALYQVETTSTFGTPYVYSDTMRLGLATSGGDVVQRPVGVFHNSNILGQWLVFSTLLLLPTIRFLSRKSRWVVVGVVGVVMGLTYSRAIWIIGAALAVLILLRWTSRSMARVGGLCIGLGVVGSALLVAGLPQALTNALPDRFELGDVQRNLQLRENLNEYGLAVVGEHPIVGVGYLQYPTSLVDLRPHNVFIQVAAEQGVLTAVTLGWIVCLVGFTCWRAARRVKRDDPWLSGALIALPLAWVGFLWFYSSAADYAVMPVLVTALGYLLSRVDALEQPEPAAMPVSTARRVVV